jgi:hypothetical protein
MSEELVTSNEYLLSLVFILEQPERLILCQKWELLPV